MSSYIAGDRMTEQVLTADAPVVGAQTDVAVVALAVDHLIALEDLFGKAAGSAICRTVAARIRGSVPAVARLSWAQQRRILVCLPGFDLSTISDLVVAVQTAVASEPVMTDGGPIAVSVSAGSGQATGLPTEAEDRAATQALHELHRAACEGPGSHCHSAPETRALLADSRLSAIARVACGAASPDQLAVSYQPVVRSDGKQQISFHECLARILHPDGSVTPAHAFLPELERLGLTPALDRQMLTEVFRALAENPTLRLSLNVTRRTVHDQAWMRIFKENAAADPTLPERLIIEISEDTSMFDMPLTHRFMETLRPSGVCFAIDDFGAGRASIHHLRALRFDIVKIDGEIIRGIDQSPDGAFTVETLVRIAEHFEMMTVAESVETQEEARVLQRLGVGFFQGFRFGSPSLRLGATPSPMTAVAAQA